MKNYKVLILTILTIFCITKTSEAQTNKGYLGISIGAAIPTGTFKNDGMAETGLQLSLLNFGYRFTDNIGLTLNWGGSAYEIDSDLNDITSFGYLAIGPMFTIPAGYVLSIDIKPQYAFVYGNDKFIDGSEIEYTGGSGILFGTSLNFDLGGPIGLSFNTDIFSISKFKEATVDGVGLGEVDFEDNINSFNITIGIQYRF
jgi:hypothetical protein